jgi:glutathione S-transferase
MHGNDCKDMCTALEFAERKLGYLHTYIGQKTWVCGDLTFADFVLCETT